MFHCFKRLLALLIVALVTIVLAFNFCNHQWRQNAHQKWLDTKAQEFEKRKDHIKKVCVQVPLLKDFKVPLNGSQGIIGDKDIGFIYCPIAKAGSTTMKDYIMQVANISTKDIFELHRRIHSVFRVDKLNITSIEGMNESELPKIAFVRHPFKRLVSAFTNKVLMTNDKGFQSLRNIVRGDFNKFVRHVINQFKCHERDRKCVINNHWMPQYFSCDFCHVSYDFIGTVGTFNDDLDYIMAKTGIFQSISTKEGRLNNSTKMERVDYMSQLDQETKNVLRDLYKIDFDLFGYD